MLSARFAVQLVRKGCIALNTQTHFNVYRLYLLQGGFKGPSFSEDHNVHVAQQTFVVYNYCRGHFVVCNYCHGHFVVYNYCRGHFVVYNYCRGHLSVRFAMGS